MNLKFSKQYYYIESGTHVVMVLNTNSNASITTAMIAATCELLNLPVICATIGHASKLLPRALGQLNVSKTTWPSLKAPERTSGSMPTSENSGRDAVLALVRDAREKRAILLLDTQIVDGHDAEALVQAMCLMRKETISIVWPIFGKEDVEAGPRFINIIKPEQCMIHVHDFGYAGIKKCGINSHFLMRIPQWHSEGLTTEMKQVLMRKHPYSYLPPFPNMPKYYDDLHQYILPEHKPEICNLISHLYSAAEATRKHVFDPIAIDLF